MDPRNIEFVRLLEIYFPYSLQVKIFWWLVVDISLCRLCHSQNNQNFHIQTHPSSFPGQDPNDCPRDASKVFVHQRGYNFPIIHFHMTKYLKDKYKTIRPLPRIWNARMQTTLTSMATTGRLKWSIVTIVIESIIINGFTFTFKTMRILLPQRQDTTCDLVQSSLLVS